MRFIRPACSSRLSLDWVLDLTIQPQDRPERQLNEQSGSEKIFIDPPPPGLRQIAPAFGHTKPSFLVATRAS